MTSEPRLNTGLVYNAGQNGSWRVYFDDLMDHLCEHISEADEAYGCAFRLTNERVIEALGGTNSCQILVDKGNQVSMERYHKLKCTRSADAFFEEYSMAFNDGTWGRPLEPIRVVGSHTDGVGLMHQKFMIFVRTTDSRGQKIFDPYGIWMGSCNFSCNADRSLEGAIFSRDRTLVRCFLKNYVEVLARSESLYDYRPYFAPQWYRLTA